MKNEYFKKLAIRAKQRAKLLIARPDFQENVLAIRTRFKIPSGGFKDDEINQKWHHEFYQSDDYYFETVWLKRREEIIQLKKERKFREAEELQKQLNNEAPINALRIAIKDILKKYKLPLGWEHSIRRYILFNSIDLMWLPGGITVHEELDTDTRLKRLSIGIDDSTTLEDIKQFWSMIKFHQKHLHSYVRNKFQPIPNFDRDRRAYDLQKKGKTLDEIGEIINVEFDDGLDNNQINIAIKRYKKRLNIN